ncbi:two-component system sensor histidine kinase NtrB [Desulforhabdus amnigena]|jgi:signal transduction histidine kinase|uniref:histidine kinase n=1 Tax=Desulforhabdus amnigena TaxID=40218 RepID=A0A9W6D375_9BACT|nr:ATP-binding protein [Desulforhabdus amnigena]NLJ28364.1 two-component sensor histidine kinase [Deltaproteobacteria bacterium]GLI33355.1 two-component sensor histidine kinase [Desulforhabdus amnigena]
MISIFKAKAPSQDGGQSFQLVKYVSLSSLMVILVCTFFLSGFISQRVKAILLSKSEQYASLVAENLNHQVFFQFTLPTLISDGEIRLSRETQYERLDKVVRNTIHGFSVERVNIYNPQQILTYSTEPDKVGTKGNLENVFDRALREESVSFLVGQKKSFLGIIEWSGGIRKLKTYFPMWEEKPMSWKRGKVLGVFEIIQDMTHDYELIHRFQLIVVLSFLVFVGIVFVTILLFASRAEKIIEARSAEKKKLEDRLHQAERLAALGEMVAGVSHEIRNPLGIIRSTAELLHTRIESERQKRFTSIIVEEATRLNDILTEFLDFARPKTIRASRCCVEDILERNLKMIEPECLKLGISVERYYQNGCCTLEADMELLYRAFFNLMANALQAMPSGGTLRVRSAWLNDVSGPKQVEVRIEDTGFGIPPELQNKIFNPFFTTREKGTGLGLAIVQTIIDSHNGYIEVDSKAGQGTAVVIRLPVSQPELKTENEKTV